MMSQHEEIKEPHGKASRSKRSPSKEDLRIEQVRVELETYFAPQNIQNDFNLRQKMTTDGFIDINHLLDLKLMADLATSREHLIEAISRSKLLKMNTGCTMVKYMPILERNILILRDIPDKTMKEEILTIFDNAHCSVPFEVHSDIGNHWFCRFRTEEECLSTAQYLNLHGLFKGEKLHVRVKAIHDKNKADTSPQMQNAASPKASKSKRNNGPPPPPQPYGPQMPYSPGQWYAYYGTGAVAEHYGGYSGGFPPGHRGHSHRAHGGGRDPRTSADPDQSKANGAGSVTPPPAAQETTVSSDYPGVFDKYPMETFLEIYSAMEEKGDLDLPQSMRGRDLRIISDELLLPVAVSPAEETKGDDDPQRNRRKKNRRKKRKEMVRGHFYEDEAFEQNGQLFYEEYPAYFEDDEDYERGRRGRGGRAWSRGRGGRGGGDRGPVPGDDGAYFYNFQTSGDDRRRVDYYDADPEASPSKRGGGGGRSRNRRGDSAVDRAERRKGAQGGTRQRSARQYNSRRAPPPNPTSPGSGGKKKKKGQRDRARAAPKAREVWAPKGSAAKARASREAKGASVAEESLETKWVPKGPAAPAAAKRYATNRGVYQAKSPSSSN